METVHRTNLRELSSDERRKHGLSSGIKVTGPLQAEGIRWNNNISPGFIICSVNGQPVADLYTLKHQLRGSSGARISGVYLNGTHDTYFIALIVQVTDLLQTLGVEHRYHAPVGGDELF